MKKQEIKSATIYYDWRKTIDVMPITSDEKLAFIFALIDYQCISKEPDFSHFSEASKTIMDALMGTCLPSCRASVKRKINIQNFRNKHKNDEKKSDCKGDYKADCKADYKADYKADCKADYKADCKTDMTETVTETETETVTETVTETGAKLKTRDARAKDTPPKKNTPGVSNIRYPECPKEVKEAALIQGYAMTEKEAENFFRYYEARNWKNEQNTPIVQWRSKIPTWMMRKEAMEKERQERLEKRQRGNESIPHKDLSGIDYSFKSEEF